VTVPAVRWAVLGVVLLGAFAGLGVLVAGAPLGVDLAVTNTLSGLYRGFAGQVAGVVSDVLGPVLPILLGGALLIATALSLYRREFARAALFLRVGVVLSLCRSMSVLGKPLFHRDRPRLYPELSYPSGHVVSVASTGFAAVLLCGFLAPRLLRKVALVAALVTVLSALARLVLGVHWLTDTIGAVLGVLGIGLLAAVALRLPPVVPPRPVPADDRAA
jgi:membrane-associated phospholipid phosphatase